MPGINKDRIFGHIIEEHVSNAAFLWMLRDTAVNQAHQTPTTLSKLESRITKHLTGCLAAQPDVSWEYALEAADTPGGGESFVLSTLAFHQDNRQRIQTALDVAGSNPNSLRGLISALAWLPDARIFPWLQPWMYSEDSLCRYLSVAVCSLRRLDPKDHLKAALSGTAADDFRTLNRALRLIGELKRRDLHPYLTHFMNHSDANVRFWASWSALTLGDDKAIPLLQNYITTSNPHQRQAIAITLRCMDADQTWASINALIQTPNHIHQAILALAALGDCHGINWLLSRMEERDNAQLAGEAFTLITGIEITGELEQSTNSTSSADQEDGDDDEAVSLKGFESLPFPDAEKVAARWQTARKRFKSGHRYFLGQAITTDVLDQVLGHGRQSQRLWAAQELAVQPGVHSVPNIKAPQGMRL